MPFTLGEIATTGLPVGEHIVRVDDIEASVNSAKTNETLVFKGTVAQSENPKVKVGAKQIWSYTYAEEWRSIIANDLVRAGLDKGMRLEGDAKPDAIVLNQYMRGNFYVIKVTAQKGDATRTNTSIVRPYAGQPAAGPSTPPASSPAPVAGPASVIGPITLDVPTVPPPVALVPPTPPVPAPVPVAAPAPAAEPRLNGELIQAVTLASSGQGPYPALNGTQIGQLREIGMDAVADAYDAARAPQPAPAAVPPPPPAMPPPGAFAAV